MTFGHGLIPGFVARLLSAAMFLLVLAAAPSMAFAHTGHAHAANAPSKGQQVVAARHVDTAKAQPAKLAGARVSDAVLRPAPAEMRADGACAEACCSSGLSCCMALEPCRTPALARDLRGATLPAGEWRRVAGLSPPGLTRPPRNLV